ncbi:MAG: protein-export chaperone SecB [Candidatus Puniceispirillaceae bacterium]
MAKKKAKAGAKAPKAKSQNQQDTSPQAEQPTQQRRPLQVMIHSQYVKDLSFENPNAVSAHLEPVQQPQVEIGVNVNADKVSETQYEVRLNLTAKAITDDKPLFLVDLTYAAIVSVPEATPDEINPLVMIEGPRLIFPFARSIISNMTRDGGFMPLNLQPVDFVAVYRHSLEQQRQQQMQQAEEATKQ